MLYSLLFCFNTPYRLYRHVRVSITCKIAKYKSKSNTYTLELDCEREQGRCVLSPPLPTYKRKKNEIDSLAYSALKPPD